MNVKTMLKNVIPLVFYKFCCTFANVNKKLNQLKVKAI